MTTYDYIVVGAGSAGCVLARRLSDDRNVRVLLLEAGGPATHPFIRMPRGFFKMWEKPEYFWSFPVRGSAYRPAEVCKYGKVMGGSSSLNGMWYLRGMPADFEAWRSAGNPGWGWADVERIYKELEDYQEPGADASRGKGGPLQITQQPYRSPVISAVFEAGKQLGLPLLDDINTPNTEGIGTTQLTIDRRGQRASSYAAFVKPVEGRPNLTIHQRMEVKRVTIANGRATGVVCDDSGIERTFTATREVILSGGVIQSPKLLQLSGIGPRDVLGRAGVPVVAGLEHVGRNFCDQTSVSATFRLTGHPGLNREFSTWRLYVHVLRYYLGFGGLMAAGGMPITVLYAGDGDKRWPHIQLGISPFSMQTKRGNKSEAGRGRLDPLPGIMFNGFDLRPKSRGAVEIVSGDHRAAAQITMNWWDHPDDLKTQIAIIRLIRRFARADALRPFIAEENVPGEEAQTDEQIFEELKWLTSPGLHANGTCRMGPDAGAAVVDAKLRVHGVEGLRVADCSIMPTPVSGNTNGTAMMIGARAAELIQDAR